MAWARLGIDPVETGVRLVDGHEFATAAAGTTGALLVAHTHANWVLSDIKLAIDDADGTFDGTPVTLLHRLGTADEQIVETTWGRMDRAVDADHLELGRCQRDQDGDGVTDDIDNCPPKFRDAGLKEMFETIWG